LKMRKSHAQCVRLDTSGLYKKNNSGTPYWFYLVLDFFEFIL